MSRSSYSTSSSCQNGLYALSRQYQQPSEALQSQIDLARMHEIDAEIDRLSKEKQALAQRVDPYDLVGYLSGIEAQCVNENERNSQPTWTMVGELILQNETVNNMLLDALAKCETLEKNEDKSVTDDSFKMIQYLMAEKREVQQELHFAQSEIRMLRFAEEFDAVIESQKFTDEEMLEMDRMI
ncbi:hypothetical protein ACLX1H_010192 [Fusarium chlamydosporum]